jgi:hypothetical protein
MDEMPPGLPGDTAPDLVDGVAGPPGGAQQPTCFGQQSRTGLGQRDRRAVLGEPRHAEFRLQLVHRGRLRRSQAAGAAGEAALFGHAIAMIVNRCRHRPGSAALFDPVIE